MSNEVLISIVVPVFNVENFLEKCLNSVISQTYTKLEIILVNDGSTDNSKQICEDYQIKDHRIKVIDKVNGGLANARNVGIAAATGKYVSFIDSDDYVSKQYISNLYEGIKKGAQIAISERIKFTDENEVNAKIFENKKIKLLKKQEVLRRIFNQDLGIEAWGKLYLRSFFSNVQYSEGKYYEDLNTTHRLIEKAEKIAYVNTQDYFYRQRSNSINNEQFNKKKMDILIVGKLLQEDMSKKFPELNIEVASKLFSAYSNVWMQIPKDSAFIIYRDQLWQQINFEKRILLKNFFKVKRLKVIGALILSTFGKEIYRIVYLNCIN